jgi:hypothetical protein
MPEPITHSGADTYSAVRSHLNVNIFNQSKHLRLQHTISGGVQLYTHGICVSGKTNEAAEQRVAKHERAFEFICLTLDNQLGGPGEGAKLLHRLDINPKTGIAMMDLKRIDAEVARVEKKLTEKAKLAELNGPALQARTAKISEHGAGGVLFLSKPENEQNFVVAKFDSRTKMQAIETTFIHLNTINRMTELPFEYGSHVEMTSDDARQAVQTKLQALQISKPDRRLDGMLAQLDHNGGAFSIYTKLEGHSIVDLSAQQKFDMLYGSQFPHDMGKSGFIASFIGLGDHGGVGLTNFANYKISDTGRLALLDIDSQPLNVHKLITAFSSVQSFFSNPEEKINSFLTARNPESAEPNIGLGGFFEAITLPGDKSGACLFKIGQESDQSAVLDLLEPKDKQRLAANYLLGVYEAMNLVVQNQEQFEALFEAQQPGAGRTLFAAIQAQHRQIQPEHLVKMKTLAAA